MNNKTDSSILDFEMLYVDNYLKEFDQKNKSVEPVEIETKNSDEETHSESHFKYVSSEDSNLDTNESTNITNDITASNLIENELTPEFDAQEKKESLQYKSNIIDPYSEKKDWEHFKDNQLPFSYQNSKDLTGIEKSSHIRVKSSPPIIEGNRSVITNGKGSPLVNPQNQTQEIPSHIDLSTEFFGNTKELDPETIIRLENLQKTYLLGIEGVPALRGITLEVKKGEFLIIYGTSGGGKTSLLNIIGTIDKATKGNIFIGTQQIREHTRDSEMANIRLKKIGFVFQTFNLLGTMTALENVEMPMILLGKLGALARRKRAKELLKLVGMGERMHHKPAQLSGGEQQRVTIARAIANNPEIMILDEPTGDLDTKNSRIVMNLLRQLNREHKITMVMVTHDPSLKNGADRVIRIRDGRISGEEIISKKSRGKFWSELKRQMPTEVQDDDFGDVKKDELRKFTEIREPRNYAQFRNCLDISEKISDKLLNECISRREKEGQGVLKGKESPQKKSEEQSSQAQIQITIQS